jgi:hypothetical protein
MSEFIVLKVAGDDIIINSDKIIAVTSVVNSKKTFIQTGTHFFTVDESMDEIKKILHVKTPGKKGSSTEVLLGRI